MERSSKRRRLSNDDETPKGSSPFSFARSISPPRKRTRQTETPTDLGIDAESPAPTSAESVTPETAAEPVSEQQEQPRIFRSPFQLTKIRDLPEEANRDAVSLEDLLGDPLISECWNFNYLHDIDFLMNAFDVDVRKLVKVHVVHGFWKRDDPNGLQLQMEAAQYDNVKVHTAYLPEMFGTHHSKMLLLLRHDDTAEVIIHTANMIPRDWRNMTQAVWRSPRLPLLPGNPSPGDSEARIGTGDRFKADLFNYLRAYDRGRFNCNSIINSLSKYDFSAVKGALIASVPGRHNINDDSPKWGWNALKRALRTVPVQDGPSEIVVQISSISTLGPTITWLRDVFFDALAAHRPGTGTEKPTFKIVFPTADEIRRCLDGYAAGGSIHTKIQSAQQAKQLQYLRPMYCHWANDAPDGAELPEGVVIQDAGRQRAAPHIKTYIRYGKESIDWAMVTSANISKQAWGEAAKNGEMRISSYEIGVLVWPSLFDENAVMLPVFGKDEFSAEMRAGGETRPIVPIRMPYSLPLQPYGRGEIPWVATASYSEPDWKGQKWE